MAADPSAGPFAFDGLDRVLHEKARLGILSSLAANPQGLLFTELKDLCSLTDGNLNRHMQVLQEAGLIEISKETGEGKGRRKEKRSRGSRTQTLVRMTPQGRRRFMDYLALLERIVHNAIASSRSAPAATRTARDRLGWTPG